MHTARTLTSQQTPQIRLRNTHTLLRILYALAAEPLPLLVKSAVRSYFGNVRSLKAQAFHVVRAVATVAEQQLVILITLVTNLLVMDHFSTNLTNEITAPVHCLVLLQYALSLHLFKSLCLVLENLRVTSRAGRHFKAHVAVTAQHVNRIHQHHHMCPLRGISTQSRGARSLTEAGVCGKGDRTRARDTPSTGSRRTDRR